MGNSRVGGEASSSRPPSEGMGEGEIAPAPALVSATADEDRLKQLGIELAAAPLTPADALVELLEQVAECLHGMRFSGSVLIAIGPLLEATVREEFLKHEDEDVKVLLSFCFCEITRITMPDVPYTDDVLRDIFYLIVGTFNGLSDVNSKSFGWIAAMLATLETSRLCVLMIDIECEDLMIDMFQIFLKVLREDHEENILRSMQSIMASIIDESDEVPESLLRVLLSALGWKKTGAEMSGRKLARNVVQQEAGKLEPYIKAFLTSSLTGNSNSNDHIDHHGIILDVYQCTPKTHDVVVHYIIGELLADDADVRSKAVELLGQLFSLPGPSIFKSLEPLFPLFLNRLTDTDTLIEVRVSVIRNLKKCLVSNHSQPEALKIIKALCDILLDHDENVGKEVVAALCDVACHSVGAIPVGIMKIVADYVQNTSMALKWYTMKRMADIYRLYCMKGLDGSMSSDDFGWIPGKILKCLYGELSLELLESILCDSLFPPEFPIKGRVKFWVVAFSYFDKVEMEALEQILVQKQRLQQEMLKYMSLRNLSQEDDPDVQKIILRCFRTMSHLFSDPVKCKENMNILHQLKDANVWKIFSGLLDCSTTFKKAWSLRVDLLSILGENHALYDFVSMLAMRCSYSLMNKEYAKYLLSESCDQKSVGNTKLISSCLDLLTAISCFFPSLLYGLEEDIIELLMDLKDDNAGHGDDVPGLKSAAADICGRTTVERLDESRKRHKPKSICSLGKCCAQDSSSTDLTGQRIEVWWPADKKFYEGVVHSYDSSKRRHTVLYDDGDIEVLNLAKKKWRIIENDESSMKHQQQKQKDYSWIKEGH